VINEHHLQWYWWRLYSSFAVTIQAWNVCIRIIFLDYLFLNTL